MNFGRQVIWGVCVAFFLFLSFLFLIGGANLLAICALGIAMMIVWLMVFVESRAKKHEQD